MISRNKYEVILNNLKENVSRNAMHLLSSFYNDLNKKEIITLLILALLIKKSSVLVLDNSTEVNKVINEMNNKKQIVREITDPLSEFEDIIDSAVDKAESEVKALTPEEIIMAKYNLTKLEFKTICGVVLAESLEGSYEDAYAVINTIYNRTKSKTWINEMERVMGRSDGDNLYVQVICPGQFSPYMYETYKLYWDDTTSIRYQAIIDFLLTEKPMHNYLNFWGDRLQKEGSVQFVEHGNRYFNPMPEEDRVETLQRTRN